MSVHLQNPLLTAYCDLAVELSGAKEEILQGNLFKMIPMKNRFSAYLQYIENHRAALSPDEETILANTVKCRKPVSMFYFRTQPISDNNTPEKVKDAPQNVEERSLLIMKELNQKIAAVAKPNHAFSLPPQAEVDEFGYEI